MKFACISPPPSLPTCQPTNLLLFSSAPCLVAAFLSLIKSIKTLACVYCSSASDGACILESVSVYSASSRLVVCRLVTFNTSNHSVSCLALHRPPLPSPPLYNLCYTMSSQPPSPSPAAPPPSSQQQQQQQSDTNGPLSSCSPHSRADSAVHVDESNDRADPDSSFQSNASERHPKGKRKRTAYVAHARETPA